MKRVIPAALMLLVLACASMTYARAETTPVRILLGKRELRMSPTPAFDGTKVLVPTSILESLGATFSVTTHNGSIRITAATGATGDVQPVSVDDTTMLPLDEVVKVTGGEMAWDAEKRTAALTSQLKSVEFVDDTLKINCSFPVTVAIHKWASHVVVDLGDTRLASEAKEVTIGTSLVGKARLGQPEENQARVVLDLTSDAGYKLLSPQPSAQVLLQVGEGLATPPSAKPAVSKPPANQPYTIESMRLESMDDDRVDVLISTSGRASVSSTFSVNPSSVGLVFENATLSPSAQGIESSHPLLSSISVKQSSSGSVRLSVSLNRIVAPYVSVQDQGVVLSIRLPEHAGGSLSGKHVVVDPGHGGREKGACAGNCMEKDVNLKIASAVAEALEREGARVTLTRYGDEVVSLATRPTLAMSNGADFLVSIHCNSNGSPGSASGIETYYHMYEPSPRALAFAVHEGVCLTTGMCDRRARSDRSLYSSGLAVLRKLSGSGIPGVLVECGYINNSSDRAKLQSSSYREKLAEGIVLGLKAYVEGTPLR